MPKKNRPLPKPPKTPFGKKKRFEEEDPQTLMADRMAMAAAEGRLGQFFEREMPDNEHARKLAEMMMGMTGMMPGEGIPEQPSSSKKVSSRKKEAPSSGASSSAAEPPEGVVEAVKNADVKGLMDMLEKEHKKRQGGKAKPVTKKKKGAAPVKNQASVEKEVIEQLLKISADNGLDIDWIVFRALKRYVEEYKKTGNL